VALQTLPEEIADVRSYCTWFANLRWVAVLSAATLSAFACYELKILPTSSFKPLMVCLTALAVFNVVLIDLIPKVRSPYALLIVQAATDLVALTFLLHYSGGLENPLFTLYILHVIIGSILLERRDAQIIVLLSCTLLLALAAEHVWPFPCHVRLGLLPESVLHTPIFALGVATPYAFILVTTGYILRMVREQLHNTANQRRGAYEQLLRQEKIVVLGEVAAGVAHEINNPLHGVRSCLTMLKTRAEPDGPVEAWVQDSGCGIPPESMDRIFHPFFTTKAIGKGSGLGLSISKRIVEDHGGTIAVESRMGQGSRFTMRFPASAARGGETEDEATHVKVGHEG